MSLKKNKADVAEGSSSVTAHKGWLELWNTDIPGKVKIHIWRMIRNGLAVGEELFRRRIKAGVFCIACGRDESVLHRFWRCPHSAYIWERLGETQGLHAPAPPAFVQSPHDMKNWFLDWLGQASESERALVMVTIYQIWLARNDARDGERCEDPGAIVDRALHLLEEWHQVKEVRPCTPQQQQREQWQPPVEGWSKVNADGAIQKSSGDGGGGAVLRDHHGNFVAAACHFFPSVSDPELAELLACRRAAGLAIEMGSLKVVLETDNKGIAQRLASDDLNRSVYGPLIEEIKGLLQSRHDFKVKWVRRSANVVAHRLAKEGCGNKLCKTWLHVPPECIMNSVLSERSE